jgi:zinc transport system substrate-binding protein
MARAIARADLVLLLGLEMDGWVAKLARSERIRTVVVSEGIENRPEAEALLAEFTYRGSRPTHLNGRLPGSEPGTTGAEVDPHIWLDPLRAQQIVQRIAGVFVDLVPWQRAGIEARAADYAAALRQLHDEFVEGLASLPRRKVVTFHAAFAYLFERYGLETIGVIEPFPGKEPSAAYLRELVGLMRAWQIDTIFAEPQLPDRPARVIAREIGGRVERLDPCETLLVGDPDATYLDRQRRNLATLRRVLGGGPQP